jgi:large subunit ribosomal protein L22
MAGWKTNEYPGTRAELRHCRMSATKARAVLSLIRGRDVGEASQILQLSERDAARVVGKVLASAVANAEHNDQLDPEQLYVATCYADEANSLKRWRPRARGRPARVRKRSCHITVIVSRLPEDRLRMTGRRGGAAAAQRARRVAAARRAEGREVGGREEADAAVAPIPVAAPEEETPEAEEAVTAEPEPEALTAEAEAEEAGASAGAEEEEGEAATDEDVAEHAEGEPGEGTDAEEGE